LAAALAVAALTYHQFRAADRYLWYNSTHDRNSHYLFALRLATDVEHLRVYRFLDDVGQSRVWPPLQGLLTAGVLLVGGLDYRLAVLPSLAGWVVTVFFGYLLARRALPQGGQFAGLVAALFVAASPAHRAYATDIMLESLGAGLTMVVLYCYAVLAQSKAPAVWPAPCLGLALTALFLQKYNYWTLTVLALVATDFTLHPRERCTFLWNLVRGADWRRLARGELRRPLNYALAVLLAVIVAIILHGDRPYSWNGRDVALYPPHNFIQAAYLLLFLRLAVWWWRGGRAWISRLDGRVRTLLYWHAAPFAVYMLLPKHVSYFLWFLSPSNRAEDQHASLVEGLKYYTNSAVQDFHAAPWCAALAGLLIVATILTARRLRAGTQAALWLFLFGVLLTATHPNHKGRFLHSWLASGWVLAGVGAATIAYGRLTVRVPRVRPYLAAAAIAALACAFLPPLRNTASSPEGGPHPQAASVLDVTDAYLPAVKESRRTAIFAAVPVKPLAQWTFLEERGGLDRLEDHWYGFGPAGAANRQGFYNWLQSTSADTLVYVDRLPGGGWEEVPEVALHAELRDLILGQNMFRLVRRCDLPQLGCSVLVFTAKDGH
jgi:hypothetical protein